MLLGAVAVGAEAGVRVGVGGGRAKRAWQSLAGGFRVRLGSVVNGGCRAMGEESVLVLFFSGGFPDVVGRGWMDERGAP